MSQTEALAYAQNTNNILKLQNLILDEIFATISAILNRSNVSSFTTRMKNNEASNIIWTDVYMKWNQLSQDAKNFYKSNLNFMKRVNNNWEIIPESEMGNQIQPSDFSNYRINL